MNAVTHLEKVITGEVSAVTHLEKVIAGETSAVTYTEKVIASEAPPITHLQKVIAGEASPVTHLEYVWVGGTPSPTEHEYTGAVPYTFTANGSPLISWQISGNTVQSGTPTPDNPVMPQGTGERTGNLFDGGYTVAVMSVSGNIATLNTASSGRTAIVECESNTTYTVKKHSVSNRFIIAESDIKPVNGTAMSIIQNDSSKSEYTFTTSNTAQYVVIYCSTSSEQAEPRLMVNTGSTALPYEPYGYKIPISSASTTTPIYLGEVETTRKIKKLVFKGDETENWGYSSSKNNARVFLAVDSMAESPSISTHYQFGVIRTYPNLNEYCINNASSLVIGVDKNSITSAADFKTYLAAQYAAGTPVTVWYVLDNPETAVVNEPLMKIGEYSDEVSNVATIPTVNGSNTFDVDTTLKPSEVYIKYKGV